MEVRERVGWLRLQHIRIHPVCALAVDIWHAGVRREGREREREFLDARTCCRVSLTPIVIIIEVAPLLLLLPPFPSLLPSDDVESA